MARGRVTRGLERLLELVPHGVELAGFRDLVSEDLVADEALADLAGAALFDARAPSVQPVVGRSDLPRIRPILVALAARATGASRVDRETQHAAELLHLALRVHDLALGNVGGRRRRVARRVVRSVGWITGNQLTVRALELSRHAPAPGVLEELLEALRSFADAQALSRELAGVAPTEADWLEHADAHTGALFTFCCRAGGHLSGASARDRAALGRYGRHVGRLWHVAEDVSVLEHGEPALHLVSRAVAGRPVLPVAIAIELDPSLAEVWTRLATDADPDEARTLAARVCAIGVPRALEAMAKESWTARRAIRVLPDTRYRAAMERLASELAKAGVPRRDIVPFTFER